jgi:hypothetical protein
MKINQQLLQINRNFLICFIVSAAVSAVVAQLLADYENHLNTTITIIVGYVIFFGIFGSLFYLENKKRYQGIGSDSVKHELMKMITSFGIGEAFYLVTRWFSLFYLLEFNTEPYIASLTSEIASTLLYMLIVSVFLKATKTF